LLVSLNVRLEPAESCLYQVGWFVFRHLTVGKQNYLLPKSEIQTIFVVCPARSQVTLQNTNCCPRHAGLQIQSLI